MARPGGSELAKIYEGLEKASPEEKTNIVLGLIEEHPEHILKLPMHDGKRPNLQAIDFSRETLEKRIKQSDPEDPVWLSPETKGVNLWRADLQGANLEGANLLGAYFENADLQGADLRVANLQHAYLFFARLQGAYLWRANLQGANLWDTDLQGANLEEANLKRANLKEAKLQGVDLTFVQDMTNIYISDAWLDRTRIRREQLGGAIGEEIEHAIQHSNVVIWL